MSNVFQALSNSVFPPSDPMVLCSALIVVYKNITEEDRLVLSDPTSVLGLQLTRALQMAVDQNDAPCIMLLFSPERAEYLLNTEKPSSARHKKGLKLLSQLQDLPPTVFDQLFDPLVKHNKSWVNLPLEEMVASFVKDVRNALVSHAQHKKIARAVAQSTTLGANKKM